MEFRWIAVLALWTMLIGPMLDAPLNQATVRSQPTKLRDSLKRLSRWLQ